MKILYVEGNPEDAELVQRRLRKHSPQFALDVVTTQTEAIAWLSNSDERPIDLVLTDLHLPDGDGISLLTHIRTRGTTVPVVVITADVDETTAVTVLKAGADDYVYKRSDYLDRLPTTLENALRRHPRPIGPAPAFKVLYVESDEADIELTCRHFKERAPYIVLDVVRTGAEAMRRLTDASATFDVILIDDQIPDPAALEILKQLRQNHGFDIPVVLITAQHGEEAVLRAFRLEATGYLVKNSGYLHQLPGELESAFYRAEIIRKQTALNQSEERLRRAQGAARVGTWDWNLNTGESYWSDGIYELLGLAHGDGRSTVQDFVRFIHPEDREPVMNNVESAIKNGEDYYGEFRVTRGDGSIAWLSSKGRIIRDTSGSAERMIGVNIDITERKRAEQALCESEQRFRSAFDHATIGMALVANDGRLLQVNLPVCKLLGYSEQELLGTNVQSLTHPQDLDANREYRRQILAGEIDAFQMEKRYIHKSGCTVWALLSVSLLRDGDGHPLYFISQVQDITERKRAESRFSIQYSVSRILSEAASLADASPRLLKAICESLDCEYGEIWITNREAGRLTLLECWSQPSSELVKFASASRQFHFYPDEGIPGRIWKSGQPVWITKLVNEPNFLRGSLARKAGLTSGLGFPALVGDHAVAVMMFFSRGVQERDEDTLRMTLTIGDQIGQFAERKQAEEALRRSHAELERRTLQLRRLASDLTLAEQHAREELAKTLHDGLQQLLFSAVIMLDRAIAGNSPADQVALLQRARAELNEAMEAARTLSVNLFPPMLHIVGLHAALSWLAKRTQQQYGVVVKVTADPQANPATSDVRILLFEAVRELLFNAVKHAHVDRVDVNLEVGPDDTINIHVSDEGIGFDPALTLHHKNYQQVGLGLFSIEERLALFGGRLDVQSAPGKGARFSLILPRSDVLGLVSLRRSHDASWQERLVYDSADGTSKPLRILIADDHVVARAGLRELLSEQPVLQVVGEAANGVEAISQAMVLQPDVIVMDVSMPQMNGIQATREIRGVLPHIQIVGLSTHDDENSERSMREAGAEAYFTKNEGAERLLNYLLSVQTRAKGVAKS